MSDQSEVVLKHNIMLDLLASANALREFALASSLFPSLTGVSPCRRPAACPPPFGQFWEKAVAVGIAFCFAFQRRVKMATGGAQSKAMGFRMHFKLQNELQNNT